LGAQINAFFFEKYAPLNDGLGTYISQMHDEHGAGSPRKSVSDDNLEIRQ
jgi:hypothetical protein